MQYAEDLRPVELSEIKEMAKKTDCNRIYVHWTGAKYGEIYSEYHVSIDYDGKIYLPFNCHDFDIYRAGTYMRNTGSINVALCGCYDACANNGYNLTMGSNPITEKQIETVALVVATICKYANIDIEDVLTHCEIAKIDGYGPFSGDPETKWDLWFLPDSAQGGKMVNGGDVIRGKARWYSNNYNL